jgi:hypothetical protein
MGKKLKLRQLDELTAYLLCSECMEYTPVPDDQAFQCDSCGCDYSRARVIAGEPDVVLHN